MKNSPSFYRWQKALLVVVFLLSLITGTLIVMVFDM